MISSLILINFNIFLQVRTAVCSLLLKHMMMMNDVECDVQVGVLLLYRCLDVTVNLVRINTLLEISHTSCGTLTTCLHFLLYSLHNICIILSHIVVIFVVVVVALNYLDSILLCAPRM